jgi:hypothetical protein
MRIELIQLELKARTVVTRKMNSQTMDTEALDLQQAVPDESNEEQSTGNVHCTSRMISKIDDIGRIIRRCFVSRYISAGCSDRNSDSAGRGIWSESVPNLYKNDFID